MFRAGSIFERVNYRAGLRTFRDRTPPSMSSALAFSGRRLFRSRLGGLIRCLRAARHKHRAQYHRHRKQPQQNSFHCRLLHGLFWRGICGPRRGPRQVLTRSHPAKDARLLTILRLIKIVKRLQERHQKSALDANSASFSQSACNTGPFQAGAYGANAPRSVSYNQAYRRSLIKTSSSPSPSKSAARAKKP